MACRKEAVPWLIVYYSTADPNFDSSSVAVGNTSLATLSAPVYRDPWLQTAVPGEKFGASSSIYVATGAAQFSGRLTLFLCDGSITLDIAGPSAELAPGKYAIAPGVYNFDITSGTLAFFRARGYVRVTVAQTGLRTCEIFLDKADCQCKSCRR